MSKVALKDVKVLTAMVTPMNKRGSVNYRKAAELSEYLADEQDTDGIVVAGTTGEALNLKVREQYHLFEVVAKAVGDRCLVIAGTGSNSTEEAETMTRNVASSGYADAVLAVVPYYNKPTMPGVVDYFTRIADCGTPTIMYNIPGRSVINMAPETIAELSGHENIVGIKECNVGQMPDYRELLPADFLIATGNDGELIYALYNGATCNVSVASHFIGRVIKKAISIYPEDPQAAANLMANYADFIDALFAVSNPILAKGGLNLLGFEVGGLRSPMMPATPEESMVLEAEMRKVGLLG